MNQNLMGIMKNLILYPQGRPSPPPLGAEAKVAIFSYNYRAFYVDRVGFT